MKSTKTTTKEAASTSNNTFTVKVTRVHQFSEQKIAFDCIANGINISGMMYIEYVTKEGKEGTMIAFPQKQGSDGKYYNHCWFPISPDLKAEIIGQIQSQL